MKKLYWFFILVFLSGLFSACNHDKKTNITDEQKSETSEVKKISFKSQVLKKDMPFNIYLPKGYNKSDKYPVLYLLHGYSCTEDWWFSSIDIAKVADRLIDNKGIKPLIIVSPLIDNSYGINSSQVAKALGGQDRKTNIHEGMYEDYIYKELVTYIDNNYSTDKCRDSRYIGGVSAGGYAALRIGFRHNDLFSRIGGHSPALFDDDTISNSLKYFLYPDSAARQERDPVFIAQEKGLSDVKVYMDCGDIDSYKFYTGCEKLNNLLQSKGVKSEYHLYSGEHKSSYWSVHADEYLMFYAGK